MKAIVVYESHWGNTAAVARAIAAGIGPDARAVPTGEASAVAIAEADLVVAGAPVLGFSLPTEAMLKQIDVDAGKAPSPPDVAQPSMRSWLGGLPAGHARSAVFETRIWWSPGGATGTIAGELAKAGYEPVAKPEKFVVKGKFGPLRDGEIERAQAWGARLARAMG